MIKTVLSDKYNNPVLSGYPYSRLHGPVDINMDNKHGDRYISKPLVTLYEFQNPHNLWVGFKPSTCPYVYTVARGLYDYYACKGVGRGGSEGSDDPPPPPFFLGVHLIHFLYKVLGLRSVQKKKTFKN